MGGGRGGERSEEGESGRRHANRHTPKHTHNKHTPLLGRRRLPNALNVEKPLMKSTPQLRGAVSEGGGEGGRGGC